MKKTKVLIIGGGPAGATTARYLSENGIDNILIQKNCRYRKPCGGGIRYTAFDEFEIDKNIAHKKVEKINIHFKEKKVFIDIKDTPIFIVDRSSFDKYLRKKAKAKGSEIIEGSFIDFSIDKDTVVSTVKTKDSFIKIKSSYLIAADGVNSFIRKKVFGKHINRIGVNFIDIPGIHTDSCSFYFGQEIAYKYYGWVFPHYTGINIGTYKGKIKNFLRFLNIKQQEKIKGFFIPVWEKNTPLFKERIIFVGDSGGQVLPFTFEGIYFAMKSGKILSDVISKEKPLYTYEKTWNGLFFKQFDSLKKLQNVFLRNDFFISVMMKLFENDYIKREMIKLWLGKRNVEVDMKFFIRVLKRIL